MSEVFDFKMPTPEPVEVVNSNADLPPVYKLEFDLTTVTVTQVAFVLNTIGFVAQHTQWELFPEPVQRVFKRI